jgi:cytochrome P450
MTKHWFSDIKAFQRDPLSLLVSRAAQSDDALVKLALGPTPVYLVSDPALVKPLLKQSEDVLDKGRLVKKISAVVGESSLTLSGDAHQKRRAILHERLSRGVANTYVGEMSSNIRMVSAQIAKSDKFRADIVGGSLALKLASVALFGHRVISQADELAIMSAFHTLESGIQAAMFRFVPRLPWIYYKDTQARKNALRTMDFVIGKVTEVASESSVLMGLKEAGLSDEEIRNELTTMIIAGFHTTGAAVAWICHYLATQPAAVERIRAEYELIADDSGELQPSKLAEAKVSFAFVKEVLRLYPSAWWLTREMKQDHKVCNVALKKGATIIVAPWVYHRSAKYFENPDQFDLEREYSGAAYVPFGAGARACVGMGVSMLELHLIALEFASSFDFKLLTPSHSLLPRPGITLNAPPMEIGVSLRGEEKMKINKAA